MRSQGHAPEPQPVTKRSKGMRLGRIRLLVTAFAVSSVVIWLAPLALGQQPAGLRPPSAFSSIEDRVARSAALFSEAGKVITHPRCINCHPAGDSPLQGDDQHIHFPPAARGAEGVGIAGAYCATCHAETNVAPLAAPHTSIPGHPRWQLAPVEMAWQGKSLGDICRQLIDPKRNGERTLAEIGEHMAADDLVAWGWNPGVGRQPVPGTQQQFGALIHSWIETGAACP